MPDDHGGRVAPSAVFQGNSLTTSTLSPTEWHSRFAQQAAWTRDLRTYIFERTRLEHAARVLEVGCGTGAILVGLSRQTDGAIHGLDINRRYLALAGSRAPKAHLVAADAHLMPYPPGSFDVTLCHFLMLWVAEPARVLAEMVRLTRPGGSVLALAEPDYGGRVDYPESLAELGRLQAEALRRQGADPRIGRRLPALFQAAGLEVIETGVLGGRWSGSSDDQEVLAEWRVLRSDLGKMLSDAELDRLEVQDRAAWDRGERVLYVPTFYAWGKRV